jgi:hypothetical protein
MRSKLLNAWKSFCGFLRAVFVWVHFSLVILGVLTLLGAFTSLKKLNFSLDSAYWSLTAPDPTGVPNKLKP